MYDFLFSVFVYLFADFSLLYFPQKCKSFFGLFYDYVFRRCGKLLCYFPEQIRLISILFYVIIPEQTDVELLVFGLTLFPS